MKPFHLAIPVHVIEYVRFKGLTGEQATKFFTYPSGNALEIKALQNIQTPLSAR